jgi:AcrR family transcriptional regulator
MEAVTGPSWLPDEPSVRHGTFTASKEAVLDAAQKLIMEHGYAGFSMRELARHSGLATGTIYHHFHDKRDIYLSVMARDIEHVSGRIREAAHQPGTVTLRLRNVIQTYLKLQGERHLLILHFMREARGLEAEVITLVRHFRAQLVDTIGSVLEAGVTDGIFRPIEPEFAVLSLFGIMNGLVADRMILDNAQIEPQDVDRTLQIFLTGLLAEVTPCSTQH